MSGQGLVSYQAHGQNYSRTSKWINEVPGDLREFREAMWQPEMKLKVAINK